MMIRKLSYNRPSRRGKLSTVLAASLLCLAGLSVAVADVPHARRQPPVKRDYLPWLLENCERLGCYYTRERLIVAATGETTFAMQPIVVKDVNTVEELIEHLQAEFKGVTVTCSEVTVADEKRTVVHLVENRLERTGHNPLDQKLDLTLNGTLGELLGRLEQRTGNVGITTRGGALPLQTVDRDSSVNLDVRQATVRQILTQAALRPGYRFCLWEADIYGQPGGMRAEIRFTGMQTPVP